MENTNALSNETCKIVRVAIQREFIERCRRNSAYSLRAFAVYLEINQSFLSKILKGKRGITLALAASLAPKLGLRLSDLSADQGSVKSGWSHLRLSEDEFELISSWQHFAVLELVKTQGFQFDPPAMAQRLGLHVEEVRAAVARLDRLGFLKIDSQRLQLLTPNTTWTNQQMTTTARKHFQRSVLELSIHALEHVPFEDRENGSVTVAINKAKLPEFKEKIRQMRKELADFFQSDGEEDLNEVYQLSVAFFPLTKVSNAKSDNQVI